MMREEVSREPTLGEKFRMEQGMEIGRKARELYPDGFLIDDMDIMSASKKTKSLMNDPNVSIIFEGTFLIDGFIAKADILKRNGDGWYMIEVKSSVNDKKEFIDDMAYTAMVIDRFGFNISNASLLLIFKDFRLGMKNENLFVEIDHTDEVLDRVEIFKPFWEQIEEITRKSVKPEPELRFECSQCELFKECIGRGIENHIFDIPRLSQSKFDKLMELGIVCIEDIPDGFPLTENQARVRNCVQTKKPFIGDKLKNELESISWPAYYLDFETVMTAIPLYPDIAPYTQILTQYSVHKCSEPSHIIDHFEYLADPTKDCRRELAKNLISVLKGEGSITVYSTFEKTVINSLGRIYPDLSGELNSLIDRMIDLEAIIRRNFYHSDFHGSTSLKKTLPLLVPDISYDELEIADGDSAMAAFAYLALGKYEDREVETIKRSLLDYCKQDTLAMVKLHERLAEYI
jgi:CRISPR/Cas system-associated exonuclease Cas4 (RecB family)